MNFMITSYFLIWALVLFMSAFVITLSKKSKRILPANHTGLPIGSAFPEFDTLSVLKKKPFKIENPERKATIVLFSSQLCPVCQTIYPLLPATEGRFKINTMVFMEPERPGDTVGIINKMHDASIAAPVYELTEAIRNEVKLEAFPFAFYLSRDGIVLSKGVVLKFDDFGLLINQGRRVATKNLIQLIHKQADISQFTVPAQILQPEMNDRFISKPTIPPGSTSKYFIIWNWHEP